MAVRQALRGKTKTAVAAVLLFGTAGAILAHQYWPQTRANLNEELYTDDQGKTWFTDSVYRVAPFEHNGRTAVVAGVYSYDNGSKQFCAFLQQFTPQGKQELEKALAAAQANHQPPNSVALYRDHNFLSRQIEVKPAGSGGTWYVMSDPRSSQVLTIHSPDGSEVDRVVP